MMPTPQDLRETLEDLAHGAQDVPGMPVTRPAPSRPRRAIVPALLVAAGVTAAVTVGAIGLGQNRAAVPLPPAAPPVPASSVPGPSQTPSPSATSAGGALSSRPMTAAEITARTDSCLAQSSAPRQGALKVRYAMVQGVVGLPADGAPRAILLLEDTGGYFDCAEGAGGWYGKGGDAVHVDPKASGFELPTISGGTSSVCSSDVSDRRVQSAVVVKTAAAVKTARVTVLADGRTRTVTVSARTGYVYVPVQVTGTATRTAATLRLELLDADGHRLGIQRYAGTTIPRLDYRLGACR